MRRREALAGIGGLGVFGAGGIVALNGIPSLDDDSSAGDDRDAPEPGLFSVETIDAPGSRDDVVSVPAPDQATFIDFFGTWCPPCVEQMPALADANERIGDTVRFMSVSTEAVGRSVMAEEVVEWWETSDGDWLLGIDPTAELAEQYLAGGYPSAAAIDANGRVQWSESGVKTADELVAGIERAINHDE